MEFFNGSIQGLLLFVIIIQNLPSRINTFSKAAIFADDTSVIISSNILIIPFSDKRCTI